MKIEYALDRKSILPHPVLCPLRGQDYLGASLRFIGGWFHGEMSIPIRLCNFTQAYLVLTSWYRSLRKIITSIHLFLNTTLFFFLLVNFQRKLESLPGKVPDLMDRYASFYKTIPLVTGWSCKPMWTNWSVQYKFVRGNLKVPFFRCLLDQFSVLKGKSFVTSCWVYTDRITLPFAKTATSWSSLYIDPLFAYFSPRERIYPGEDRRHFPFWWLSSGP